MAAFLFYNGRMLTLFRPRRLTSLIVSLAILLNLFAPALGQTVATRLADPLATEICRATPLAVNTAAGTRAPGGLPAHGLKHCMLCPVHASHGAPPPIAAGLLTVLEGHDAYPAQRPVTPWPHHHWSAAQPRGPPASA
ncbi:DUF2946 domain-containing protein [Duganella sp. FT94W]|uniref:DUF2946 domain-containing protein n=2 Tax=Duganella lactea TaxID=2692173 RepID=A0ABW9V769_9BURK|nr:DUF2946 domain-containing protein [Duganella lactea]